MTLAAKRKALGEIFTIEKGKSQCFAAIMMLNDVDCLNRRFRPIHQ